MSSEPESLPASRSQAHTPNLAFYLSTGDLNSSPHACLSSFLPISQSSQVPNSVFKKEFYVLIHVFTLVCVCIQVLTHTHYSTPTEVRDQPMGLFLSFHHVGPRDGTRVLGLHHQAGGKCFPALSHLYHTQILTHRGPWSSPMFLVLP